MLLNHYPVPVVPVFIRGTYEAMPRGSFLRRLEQVTVTFDEPLPPHDYDGDASSQEQIVQAMHERVAALGART
jgi:long-chain acyl-CoA synthetase